MSTTKIRGRISPLPTKQDSTTIAEGTPPNELGGIATRDAGTRHRFRGEAACARRRDKKAARAREMGFKDYLRSKAVK